ARDFASCRSAMCGEECSGTPPPRCVAFLRNFRVIGQSAVTISALACVLTKQTSQKPLSPCGGHVGDSLIRLSAPHALHLKRWARSATYAQRGGDLSAAHKRSWLPSGQWPRFNRSAE